METFSWLARTLVEGSVAAWPVLLVGSLGAGLGVARLPRVDAERRPAVRAALRVGWCFPLALLLVGLLASVLGGGDSQTVSDVGMAVLAAVVLAQVAWITRALWRHAGARGPVLALGVAQLALTVFLVMPALGLATGFGRTWR